MTEPQNSVQKIWQDQPVEGIKLTVEIIHKRAARFERQIRWRNIREYAASLIAASLLVYFFVTTHDVLSRVEFGLFIAALAWMVVQLHRKGSSRSMPAGVDTRTSLRFYRAELERQRAVTMSVWSWYLAPMVPGFVVYTVGHAIRSPRPATWAGLVLMDAMVAATFLFIWKLNLRATRCLGRMIDELKAPE
jgi:hypothetical protein